MPRPHKPSYFAARSNWRFTLEGKQRYICKGVRPDQKPARDGIPRVVWDEMDRMIGDLDARASAGSDPTVFFLIQLYLHWLDGEVSAGRLTAKQWGNRKAQFEHPARFPPFRDIRPAKLTPEIMDEFFAWFRSRPVAGSLGHPSAHYIHNVGTAIRACLRWAARPVAGRVPSRLIASNPLDGYGWPRQPGAVRGYVEAEVVRRFLRWAWAEARWADHARRRKPGESRPARGLKPPEQVMKSLKRRFDRIFVLMLRFQRLTGARPGEACGLRWGEVQPAPTPGVRWEPRVVVVWPGRVKTRHQTDRARKIYLTHASSRILRAIHAMGPPHVEVVFPHMRGTNAESRGHSDPMAGEPWPDGSAASAKVRLLRTAAIKAGLAGVEGTGPTRLVAYSNRHAYASEGASLGFTDSQVAEQLGNTPEVMRKVYAHTIEDHAAGRAEEIAAKRRAGKRRP